MKTQQLAITCAALVCSLAFVPSASATTSPVGIGAFGPGSTLTTFAGLPDGTEVNGLAVDGILFQYSLGNGKVEIDGGPGTTLNIAPPDVASGPSNAGTLILLFPGLLDTFGYGYALLTTSPLPNATTISLFEGATPVGSLSYSSLPDPTFTGGFAGIQSTIPFNQVQITFDSVDAPVFALDNIRTIPVAPEPGTLIPLALGLAATLRARSRQR